MLRNRLALLVMSIGLSRVVWAQAVVTQLTVAGGSSTDARGLRATTLTAAPGLLLMPFSPVNLSLVATGSRLENDEWVVGGDAALSARSGEWAHTAFTLNALGSHARTSYDATFTVGDVTPALEMRFGAATLFAGARVASGRTVVKSPAAPGASALTSLTRTSKGAVYGAQWSVLGDASPLLVSYREERSRVAAVHVVDRTAGATLSLGRLLVAGSAGRRASPVETMRFATGTLSYQIAPAIALQGSVGRYPTSLLTGAAGGRYVSLGLLWRGGVPRGERLPRPAGVPRARASETRLSIRAPGASRVDLAGDWNNWTPIPARRARNGVWYVDLVLAPGEYRYAFRVDGGAWRVPDGAVASDDGFGGKSAYVTVATSTARYTTRNQEDR